MMSPSILNFFLLFSQKIEKTKNEIFIYIFLVFVILFAYFRRPKEMLYFFIFNPEERRREVLFGL